MGWGWGGGYSRRAPSAKSQASGLSASTLAKILREKEAEAQSHMQHHQYYMQRELDRAKQVAEEHRLEELHGGKEGLALWRTQNAATLEKERQDSANRAHQAATERRIIDPMVDLQFELANLPETGSVGTVDLYKLQMNKTQAKADFHLTEKDLDALPKMVVMKEGAKRPSKISFSAHVVFEAVAAKHGKAQLRAYQAATYPAIARALIDAELAVLCAKHPDYTEKARVATTAKLQTKAAEADRGVDSAQEALNKATAALAEAHRKAERAQRAIESVASSAELRTHQGKRQRVNDAGASTMVD